jgi:hypothetical protein
VNGYGYVNVNEWGKGIFRHESTCSVGWVAGMHAGLFRTRSRERVPPWRGHWEDWRLMIADWRLKACAIAHSPILQSSQSPNGRSGATAARERPRRPISISIPIPIPIPNSIWTPISIWNHHHSIVRGGGGWGRAGGTGEVSRWCQPPATGHPRIFPPRQGRDASCAAGVRDGSIPNSLRNAFRKWTPICEFVHVHVHVHVHDGLYFSRPRSRSRPRPRFRLRFRFRF